MTDSSAIQPYDLQAPLRNLAADALRFGARNEAPRYVPQPLAEGMARVILGDDYYTGAYWRDYSPQNPPWPQDVFDIPAGQRERWEKAEEVYRQMQEEIGALIEKRHLSR